MFFIKVSHEPACRKRKLKIGSDEEEGLENEDPNNYRGTGDWRQTHEELLRTIRMARSAARARQTTPDIRKSFILSNLDICSKFEYSMCTHVSYAQFQLHVYQIQVLVMVTGYYSNIAAYG